MKRLLTLITLPLVLLLFYNQAANWHFHMLPNGIVIEHAHPYSKSSSTESPFQKHTHNEIEILILGLIFTTAVLVSLHFVSLILDNFPVKILQFLNKNHFLHPTRFFITNPHRGPPSI